MPQNWQEWTVTVVNQNAYQVVDEVINQNAYTARDTVNQNKYTVTKVEQI